jgi:hypothetical protein
MPNKSNPPTNGGFKQRASANSLVEFVNRRGHELPTNGALKLKPAAAYLGGLSVPTMHRLIKRGLLRPNRSTRHLIFLRSELDRFLTAGMT